MSLLLDNEDSTKRAPFGDGRILELVLMAAIAAGSLLTGWKAPLVMVLALAAWGYVRRPPFRESLILGLLVLLASVVHMQADEPAPVTELAVLEALEEVRPEIEAEYGELIDRLQQMAQSAVMTQRAPLDDHNARTAAFEALRLEVERSRLTDVTFLLVDPDGRAVAWSGHGLRHDLELENLPTSGIHGIASYLSVSLLAIEPLPNQPERAWRVIAGRSFDTSVVPFPISGKQSWQLRWSLADTALGSAGGDVPWLLVRAVKGPSIVLAGRSQTGSDRVSAPRSPAPIVIAVGLLFLTGLRLVTPVLALSFPELRSEAQRADAISNLALVAIAILPLFFALSEQRSVVIAAGFCLTAAGAGPILTRFIPATAVALGQALTLSLGTLWLFRLHEPWLAVADLGATLFFPEETILLRLSLWLLICAPVTTLFAWPGQRDNDVGTERETEGARWVWVSLALSIAAALLPEVPVLALVLSIGGAVALGLFSWRTRPVLGRLGAVVVLAALCAGSLWQAVHRLALFRHIPEVALIVAADSASDEASGVGAEMEHFLEQFDLTDLAIGSPNRPQQRLDLALALWQRSPLNRTYLLSAIVVRPQSGAGSSYSFGLSIDENRLHLESDTGGPLYEGRYPLLSGGQRWGELLYWFLPIRGSLALGERETSLAGDLLTGNSRPDRIPTSLPYPAELAIFDSEGALRSSTTAKIGPLPAGLESNEKQLVPFGSGRAWAWSTQYDDGDTLTLLLPLLRPIDGLWRVAHVTSGIVITLAGLLGALLVLAIPGPAFRRSLLVNLRSYSRRLIVAFTLLLLVPLLISNLVLFRTLEARSVAQQQADGETALAAARALVLDHLEDLGTGTTVEASLDDAFLARVGRIVQREVNLYWKASALSSSNPELFAAGLLPRRIPGEMYAQLTLQRRPVATRTSRAGADTSYLEVYGPVVLPGERPEDVRLFLSVPLLAQQEEARSELNDLRRRVLILTLALFLLMTVVGSRLAQSFSGPLMRIVQGTERIAGGETSLGFVPKDHELEALSTAIDDMAERVMQARRSLVQEKRVLEGVIDNITAGVVSFDRSGRIVMLNRIASRTLHLEPGMTFEEVQASEALESASSFLNDAQARSEASRTTLLLATEPNQPAKEWSLVWAPVPGEGDPAALLVVEDVSEVLRAQRLEAWAEMAKMIAHEIKNPLTPIRLSTEHLRQVYRQAPERLDEIFDRCTENILLQVNELKSTAADFSTFSRIPEANPVPADLMATVHEVVDPYCMSSPPGIEVTFEGPTSSLILPHDPKLIRRAVRNLIENAIKASGEGGKVEVEVRPSSKDGEQVIEILVTDRGPGVDQDSLERIFDPYFSTSSGGTGLGLPITRRVVEEHGGTVRAVNRPGGGLAVTMTLPRPTGPSGEGEFS